MLRQWMTEDMQMRNLSPHTQATYLLQVSLFAEYFHKSPDVLEAEHIRRSSSWDDATGTALPRAGAPAATSAQPAPPQEAINACSGMAAGARCVFHAPHGKITGTCRSMGQRVFCVPAGRGHPSGPGMGRGRRGLFYRCVRGPRWGDNAFHDNGDGTVTDRASGLMWQKADDGRTRDWKDALAYGENLSLAGHDDWRLPNVKELQSVVDYRQHNPALDQRHLKQANRKGWFWSSTTHGGNIRFATYVCFGKCASVDGVEVHGAGASRCRARLPQARLPFPYRHRQLILIS